MLIDNGDALMVWLSSVLEPLCDADPSALSKYVLALIKKDKPESELRDSMTNQMEVFLQENTNTFIESLFTTLQNGDYVEGPPKVVARKADADDLVRAHHMFSRILNLRILSHEILFAYILFYDVEFF